MSSKMVLQVALGNESLTADFALVVSFTHVRLHMDIKISFFGKTAIANLARKWLNTEVLSYVNVKTRLLRVADFAEITLERLL